MTPLEQAHAVAYQCDQVAKQQWLYDFGGGHPSFHRPWEKLDPITLKVIPAKGPDCSGAVSNALAGGNVLYIGETTQHSPTSLSTAGFMHYPFGHGEFITLQVRNDEIVQHVVLELTIPGHATKWYAATHTGGPPCGWQDYSDWRPAAAGFVARHPKGL